MSASAPMPGVGEGVGPGVTRGVGTGVGPNVGVGVGVSRAVGDGVSVGSGDGVTKGVGLGLAVGEASATCRWPSRMPSGKPAARSAAPLAWSHGSASADAGTASRAGADRRRGRADVDDRPVALRHGRVEAGAGGGHAVLDRQERDPFLPGALAGGDRLTVGVEGRAGGRPGHRPGRDDERCVRRRDVAVVGASGELRHGDARGVDAVQVDRGTAGEADPTVAEPEDRGTLRRHGHRVAGLEGRARREHDRLAKTGRGGPRRLHDGRRQGVRWHQASRRRTRSRRRGWPRPPAAPPGGRASARRVGGSCAAATGRA